MARERSKNREETQATGTAPPQRPDFPMGALAVVRSVRTKWSDVSAVVTPDRSGHIRHLRDAWPLDNRPHLYLDTSVLRSCQNC